MAKKLKILADEQDAPECPGGPWWAKAKEDRMKTCVCLSDGQTHAVTMIGGIEVCMAHVILGVPYDIPIRQLNGDTLDNQRFNLRVGSKNQ